MSVVKIDLRKTDSVLYEVRVEVGSNKSTGKLSYTDDFRGWVGRVPSMGSPHPDFPILLLKSLEGKRVAGDQIEVFLDYETNDPEASYPGRVAGVVKRYSLELTTSEEPILTHEKFKNLSDEEKEALTELLASPRHKDDFSAAAGVVNSDMGILAIAKIRKGIEAYLSPGMVWVERYSVKNLNDINISDLGNATESPPGGPPSAGGNRNWLYVGASVQQSDDGKTFDIERRWQLSEKGKWDPDLYG